ncbi:hypothetical protein [Tenacibaculum mesophilum]|nr:hypothetical protein [Tenacibaculum mesophilum]
MRFEIPQPNKQSPLVFSVTVKSVKLDEEIAIGASVLQGTVMGGE